MWGYQWRMKHDEKSLVAAAVMTERALPKGWLGTAFSQALQ